MASLSKLKFIHPTKHRLKWCFVFWINAGLLLYLTLMPAVNYPIAINDIDKVFHLIGFGSFAFFLMLAYPNIRSLWVFIISSLLGVAVELAQSQIPARSFSLADMLADTIGVALAITVVKLLTKSE